MMYTFWFWVPQKDIMHWTIFIKGESKFGIMTHYWPSSVFKEGLVGDLSSKGLAIGPDLGPYYRG